MHGFFLLLLIFGLPSFFHRDLDREPEAISVDILPIAPITNVKPQEKAPEKQEKKPEAEKKTERKATVEAKKAEEKPAEKPIPVPAKEVVKTKEKPPEQKKAKKKEDDLDSILKSVQETAKSEESKKPTDAPKETSQNKAVSENYDSTQPLSMSEKDSIRNQFQSCWYPPAGAKDAANLLIDLHVELTEDGTVTKVEFTGDNSRYNSDSFFRAAADSAMRAVQKCSPLKNLPPEKYGNWREMDLTFDPKDLL